jgi:hypothetical protein
MSALAQAALAISVVLSALGAVVLCILVVLYGFTPPGEEPAGAAARRLLLTRIGHAVAAVCFTATAILIAVVLAQPPRPEAPSAASVDARVPALGAGLEAQQSRLAQAEARLHDLEVSLHRETDRAAQAPEPAPEATVEPKPPAVPQRRVTAPRPAALRRLPAATGLATAPPARRFEPPPAPAATPAPPFDLEASALAARPGPTASAAPTTVSLAPSRRAPAEQPPRALAPPAPPRFDLRSKLREDWNTIRRGVESGEEDLRRALDDTRRNFRGLVGQ